MYLLHGVEVDHSGKPMGQSLERSEPLIAVDVLVQEIADLNETLSAAQAKIEALEERNTYLEGSNKPLEWGGFELLADYTMPGLSKIAFELGIDPTGKTKHDLVAAISSYAPEPSSEANPEQPTEAQ